MTRAKALARKRDDNLWHTLIQEQQGLVEAFDVGKLERRLQNLIDEKSPVYRGVGVSLADLPKRKRWYKR